jgi:hypothetical protein
MLGFGSYLYLLFCLSVGASEPRAMPLDEDNGGGWVKSIHEIRWQDPIFPDGRKGKQTCWAWVEIKRDGRVGWTQIDKCSEPFAAATQAALSAWEVQPIVQETGRSLGLVRLSLEFRLNRKGESSIQRDFHPPTKILRSPYPDFPRSAYGSKAKETCKGTILIDELGKPDGVTIKGCPEVFHGPLRQTVLDGWRWTPPVYYGHTIRSKFLLRVTFQNL